MICEVIATERWKQKAITDIQLLEAREQAAAGILLQIRELEKDAVSVGGIDTRKAPVRGGGNAQERRLASYLDRKAKLEQREKTLREQVKHTRRVLDGLPEREKTVLMTLYGAGLHRGEAIRRLESRMYVSRATIYRICDKALWKIAYGLGYI